MYIDPLESPVTVGDTYEFGPFRLEVTERRLLRDGQAIPLRPKVFETLCVLVEQHGKLVHKDELMRTIWPETAVEENNLALNITVLRKALGEAASKEKFIETVSGKGYRFTAKVRVAQAIPPATELSPIAKLDEAVPPRGLIERDTELKTLRECMRTALRGKRQFVCITGDAGIGKTALLQTFLSELDSLQQPVLLGYGQCVEYLGDGEAYMPVLEALVRICRGPAGPKVVRMLLQHAPAWLAQMPSLIDADVLSALQKRILGVTTQRMLGEMAEMMEALAAEHPVVLAIEDLHWADPSTIHLMRALAQHQQPARLLIIGTNRARDAGESGGALESLTQELQLRGQCCVVRPAYLSESGIQKLIQERLPDQNFASGIAKSIRERTSGNPLFAHALVDYWTANGAPQELPRGVPEGLRAMIQRKIDSWRREDEELLECASVAGMNFSAAMIASVLERNAEETEKRCFALASRGALFRNEGTAEWPDGTVSAAFAFAHSLYHEVLYEQVPPGRRANLHRQIGRWLEQASGSAAPTKASMLAFHFDAGREYERAVSYLYTAAQGALHKNAHREAASHLRRALALIENLPPTPEREFREFTVLSLLAPTLITIEGFSAPDADRHFKRARELGRNLGNRADLYPLLFSLAMTHELRGEYQITEEILKERLELSSPAGETTVLVDSDTLMACSLFHQGKFSQALERAEHGLELYDPQKHLAVLAAYGENPGVACHGWAALCLWFLGYADQAVERLRAAIKLGERPDHLYSLCFAQIHATHIYQLRRELEEAWHSAEAALALAEAQGYLYYLAFAKVVKGWIMVKRGQTLVEGLALIDAGVAVASSIGAKLDHPYLLALSAEAKAKAGQVSAALDLIAEAFTLVRNSRTFFYEAELHRLNAAFKLSLHPSKTGAAETDLETALEVARKQGAKSLELRAAMDLCELRREHRLLEPVYASFKEGFATEDLRRARELVKNQRRHRGTEKTRSRGNGGSPQV